MYEEIPEKATKEKKPLGIINSFKKVTGYKIKIQSILSLHINQ